MVCFKHCRWCAVEDCALRITDEVVCDHYKPNPQTNADRIRSMTDEKLAEWLRQLVIDASWPCKYDSDGVWDKHELLGGHPVPWLDWLKQEVTTNSEQEKQ